MTNKQQLLEHEINQEELEDELELTQEFLDNLKPIELDEDQARFVYSATMQMKAIAESKGDTETNHGLADDLVYDVLKYLGLDAIAEFYSDVDKWYA